MRHNAVRLSAIFLAVLSLGAAQSPDNGAAAVESPYSIVERGPHHRTWARVSEVKLRDDKVLYQTNSYVELATGMHYLENGQWLDTQELIEPVEGGAIAQRGPHKVRFAAQINTAGSIILTDPEGKVFRSHPLALYYMDATDGRYEMIAQIKDSTAVLVSENELVYPDTFTNFKCDLRFRYTKNGFEQDVILRQSPPPPEQFGFRAETARICVVSEFLDSPTPEVQSHVLRRLSTAAAGGPPLAEPDLIEQTLDFGLIKAYQGSAFPLGNENEGGGSVFEPVAQTGKTWEIWQGRTLLIERTDYEQIKPYVERLPKSAAVRDEKKSGVMQARASRANLQGRFPVAPAAATASLAAPVLRLALSDMKQPGFVLDYQMVTTIAGQTFRADSTYYVSNANVTLSGAVTVEGGSVVKFSKHPAVNRLYLTGTLDCRTSSSMPAFFTAKDDDTVGEVLPGSSGVIGTNRYAGRALDFGANTTFDAHDLRVRYAERAVYVSPTYGAILNFSHSQIGNSKSAIYNSTTNSVVRNVLIHDCAVGIASASSGITRLEQVTMHRVSTAADFGTQFLTNCLLISVTNGLTYTGSNNATNLSDSGIFETVGAATHYLAAGSTNRNAGTTNINPTLLAELGKRTTYPPLLLTNRITTSTNLAIQATRDTDTPDRGYHYDPIDYAVSGLSVTNATVTLAEGVSIGVYGASGAHGLRLEDGAVLTASGSPLNPSRISRYNCVQEQSVTNWSATSMGRSIVDASWGGSPRPSAQLRFVEFNAPAGSGGEHIEGDYSTGPDTAWFAFTHCQFHGGKIESIAANLAFTNCLFERVTLTDYSSYSDYHNCGFFGGTAYIDGGYGGHRAFQNLFDQTVITANYVTNGYNGYVTNFNRLTAYYPNYGSNDSIVTSISYETGALGRFYQPSNAVVCNAGGIPAADIGLYHFTAVTNQTKEGTTTVDLGFHYLALTNGVPPDYDYDGIADYLEDANGNGLGDISETLWLHSDTDYDGRSDSDEPADGTDPLNASSVNLVRLGHWRFDEGSLVGDEGQLPDSSVSLNIFPPVASWSTNALYVQSSSSIRYRETETNGRPNINLRNGTVRFWFRPDWSSSNIAGVGPKKYARLIELGGYSGDATTGWWCLSFDLGGDVLGFTTHSNGVLRQYWSSPVSLVSNRWHQFALSYSPSNTALFLNGQLLYNDTIARRNDRPVISATSEKLNTSGGGIYNYPPANVRSDGFRIGNASGGQEQAQGQFEELETFNYPLTPQQIAAGFPGFYGAAGVTDDLDYDGRSDILEDQADGTTTYDASSVTGGRLGYWRFNGATNNLLGEGLQAPLVVSGVSMASGWSSNAVVIPDGSTARVVYRDVETNGWANFNARSGAVRFWFRPNWSWDGLDGDGSFLFLGSATSESSGMWDLGVATDGKTVRLRTATNGTVTTILESGAGFDFISNNWHQVVLNYGASSSALYVNGTLITDVNVGIAQWPALADRANGLAVGNNHAGTRSINGQIDELETFNRQLTASEIWRSFESFRAMDNDLNGTPDLLEDVSLAVSTPFVGFPFAITGTLEAEQFDKGGKGVAYTNVTANFWTNDYRASQIEITNANDLGGGYCVNNLRAGEWLNYTIDVRVGQTYAVESRVAAIGTNVGGVFRMDFYTNGVKYTNTSPLSITSTNWADVTYLMVRLARGTNVMRLVLLTNAPGTTAVGKFNYISVYPAWNEWWPTNGMQTNTVTGLMTTNSTTNIWREATNNTFRIQTAIDTLPGSGVVRIPSGSYYVAQKVVDERMSSETNAAIYVTKNNLTIQGAGRTNTLLIGHNRVTTVLNLGFVPGPTNLVLIQRTNFALLDLTVEGRPHWVAVTNTSTDITKAAFTNFWEQGGLSPHDLEDGRPGPLGSLIVCRGPDINTYNHTLIFTNCLIRNAANDNIWFRSYTSNILIRGCTFLFRDGTNGAFPSPRSTTTVSLTTSNDTMGGVGVFSDAGLVRNIVVLDNIYNGNPGMTSVNTTNFHDSGDGIVWFQGGGNWFVARNVVTNYGLEGMAFNAGPMASVGNVFHTLVNNPSVTALWVPRAWVGASGVTATSEDYSFSVVNNWIYGGRYGQIGDGNDKPNNSPQRQHFTGNIVELYSPINAAYSGDYPGAASYQRYAEFLNLSGNTLIAGGHGAHWTDNCTNAIVLKNDFGAASYRALTVTSTNTGMWGVIGAKNILNQGSASHVRGRAEDAPGWFLFRNSYRMNGSTNNINSFIEPFGSPVHFLH